MKNKPEEYIALIDLLYKQKKNGELVRLPVLSGSMTPLIHPGDILKIKAISWEKCRIGDIIVFRENNKLITHRLLFTAKIGKFILIFQKGDNNRYGSLISKDDIVGKVISIKKNNAMEVQLMGAGMRRKSRYLAYKHILKTVFHLLAGFVKGERK